jgi:uncharacterized protein (TIGR03083 family)
MPSANLDPLSLTDEYRLARLRITDLVNEALDHGVEDFGSLAVPACPAWNVCDLLAHVAGIATEISRGNPPTSDSDKWVDDIVSARRGLSPAELIDEWSVSGPRFEAVAATNKRLAVPLSYDTVVHEHDLRNAIARPGAKDSSGVVAAMHVGVWLMTNDLNRHQFGSVRFRAGGRDWLCGEGEIKLELDLDAAGYRYPIWELLRLTGSRRSLKQMRAFNWRGSTDGAFQAFLHMELPQVDIDE